MSKLEGPLDDGVRAAWKGDDGGRPGDEGTWADGEEDDEAAKDGDSTSVE